MSAPTVSATDAASSGGPWVRAVGGAKAHALKAEAATAAIRNRRRRSGRPGERDPREADMGGLLRRADRNSAATRTAPRRRRADTTGTAVGRQDRIRPLPI